MNTEENYKKLFTQCENRTDCEEIKKEVMRQIESLAKRKEFRHMVFFIGIALISLVGIIVNAVSLLLKEE